MQRRLRARLALIVIVAALAVAGWAVGVPSVAAGVFAAVGISLAMWLTRLTKTSVPGPS